MAALTENDLHLGSDKQASPIVAALPPIIFPYIDAQTYPGKQLCGTKMIKDQVRQSLNVTNKIWFTK